jgi:uncharacterized protein (TIGR00730 family)
MFLWKWVTRSCSVILDQIIITFQLIYGLWHISRLHEPIVTVFGGARLMQDDPYAEKTRQISGMLVSYHVSVLTGGGPGVMQAANCGALNRSHANGFRTMGIGVEGLGQGANMCVQKFIAMRNFPARKWLLTRYSIGYIVMPGGFGTLDEMAEVATLIQTNRIRNKPIVLVGKEYWMPLFKWVMESALQKGLVSKEDVRLLEITDDLNEAVCLVRGQCELIFPQELIE